MLVFIVSCCLFTAAVGAMPENAAGTTSSYRQALQRVGLTPDQLANSVNSTEFHLSSGMNQLAGNLLRTLASREENRYKNILLSPVSIHITLSLTFYGSSQSSATREEISQTLGLSPELQDKYVFNYLRLLSSYRGRNDKARIDMANKMFLQTGFQPKAAFMDFAEVFYLSRPQTVDFADPRAAVAVINDFVRQQTRGKIADIVQEASIDALLTRMILVDAIYFKADWRNRFRKSGTRPMIFNLVGGDDTIFHVKGMNMRAPLRFNFDVPGLNAKVLELPYDDQDFSMFLMVPNGENTLDAIDKLASSFNMEAIIRSMSGKRFVRVTMPAFKAEFDTGLKSALTQLGITELFNNPDLTSISDQPLFVSEALHRAKVEVSEEGTEAAAATAVVVGIRSGGGQSTVDPEFKVDRPFVFVIYDNVLGVPLFVGRMINPSGQDNPGGSLPDHSAATPHDLEVRRPVTPLSTISADSAANIAAAPPAPQVSDSTTTDQGEKNCGELGYLEVSDPLSEVSFPCKGRETKPIENYEELRRSRMIWDKR